MIAKWNGDEILSIITEATVTAIDETTEAAAIAAKGSHWWRNRSGSNLEGQIVNEPAKETKAGASGKFGTTQRRGFYGLFLERRTPFLRPAADAVFPTLAKRIRSKVRHG